MEGNIRSDIKPGKKVAVVLKAFGVPADVVGRTIADIAAQEPAKESGQTE